MQLAKFIRELAKLRPAQMARKMHKKTVQAYQSYERSAQRTTLQDLYVLERIWIEMQLGTAEQFHEFARSLSGVDRV